MNAILGNRIKALRCSRNYTQEHMSELIGISRQKYARIENGTNNITLEVLSQIAKILEVQVGDITKVLDEAPVVAHRTGAESESTYVIFDMIDLFYANKHMHSRLQYKDVL